MKNMYPKLIILAGRTFLDERSKVGGDVTVMREFF